MQRRVIPGQFRLRSLFLAIFVICIVFAMPRWVGWTHTEFFGFLWITAFALAPLVALVVTACVPWLSPRSRNILAVTCIALATIPVLASVVWAGEVDNIPRMLVFVSILFWFPQILCIGGVWYFIFRKVDDPFGGFQEFLEGRLSGFTFTATQDFEVRALALFDEGQDGIGSYTVALYRANSSWNLVLSTVVSGLDPLSGEWRVHDVIPQEFPADNYLVLSDAPTGLNVADPVWFVGGLDQIAQTFQIGSPVLEDVSGLGEPVEDVFGLGEPTVTSILVPGALLGPNVFITPIPEPSTFVLTLIGILALIHRGRVNRR